jgi:hypothetical protein
LIRKASCRPLNAHRLYGPPHAVYPPLSIPRAHGNERSLEQRETYPELHKEMGSAQCCSDTAWRSRKPARSHAVRVTAGTCISFAAGCHCHIPTCSTLPKTAGSLIPPLQVTGPSIPPTSSDRLDNPHVVPVDPLRARHRINPASARPLAWRMLGHLSVSISEFASPCVQRNGVC